MPFTPFHLGPGLALKAAAGPRFSLLTFGLAQIAMDIEPLIGLLRGSAVLHGPSHTYLAAVLIGFVVAAISPRLCAPLLRRWNQELSHHSMAHLVAAEKWALAPILSGALLGTTSHVALDSIMHADAAPLAPWSTTNHLLGLISIQELHLLCLGSAVLSIPIWLLRAWRRQHRSLS